MEKKLGLALGSGGSRGFAHIGVLEVLEENEIPVDAIAGTSMGAFIGGLYAAGVPTSRLREMVISANWKTVFSLFDPNLLTGLIVGEKVVNFIEGYVREKAIEDCSIPFAALATNLRDGEPVEFVHGPLAQAIRASISVPVAFKPYERGSMLLADGGLSAPIPVSQARMLGADVVIAVNLDTYIPDGIDRLDLARVADNSLAIVRHHLSKIQAGQADLALDIDVGKVRWYEFVVGESMIDAGRRAAEAALPRIKTMLG